MIDVNDGRVVEKIRLELEENYGCKVLVGEPIGKDKISGMYTYTSKCGVRVRASFKSYLYSNTGAGFVILNVIKELYTEDSMLDADTLDEIGVEDVFNLKPHEYGILKLKYGLEKKDLFVPSMMKEGLKKKFYGGGDV